MNESTISNFIAVTNCDRRTACYCLDMFRGNLEIAISFYFDERGNLSVPSTFSLTDFENAHNLRRSILRRQSSMHEEVVPVKNSPNPVKSNENAKASNEPNIDKDSKFVRKYEVEDPIVIPSFLKRNKPKNPEVFFPNPQIPHILNDQLPVIKKEESAHFPTLTKPALAEVKDVPYFCITIFSNGILLHDKTFIGKDDARYDEIYKALEQCEIPSIYPEESNVEFINKINNEYVC